MKVPRIIGSLGIAGLLFASSPIVDAIDLLRDVFDSKKIDYARVEAKWAYMHHAILRLNLDEANWEGGDSTTIYGQIKLVGWTFEEKRLLTFLLFLNFQFTTQEIVAIAEMLGSDAEKIGLQLTTIEERALITAVARGVKSPFTISLSENFRRNVQSFNEKFGPPKS